MSNLTEMIAAVSAAQKAVSETDDPELKAEAERLRDLAISELVAMTAATHPARVNSPSTPNQSAADGPVMQPVHHVTINQFSHISMGVLSVFVLRVCQRVGCVLWYM